MKELRAPKGFFIILGFLTVHEVYETGDSGSFLSDNRAVFMIEDFRKFGGAIHLNNCTTGVKRRPQQI